MRCKSVWWRKKFCNGLTRAAKTRLISLVPAGQKYLVPARQVQRTNQGWTISYVLYESLFASVSTVSRGHTSLVSLIMYLDFPSKITLSILSPHNKCKYSSQIHSPWMGDIVDFGIGLSYGLPVYVLWSLAGRYDNPMPFSTLSPHAVRDYEFSYWQAIRLTDP